MENTTFETLIGLFMFYSWGHALVIIFKGEKWEGYNKFIGITALVTLMLYIIGSLM